MCRVYSRFVRHPDGGRQRPVSVAIRGRTLSPWGPAVPRPEHTGRDRSSGPFTPADRCGRPVQTGRPVQHLADRCNNPHEANATRSWHTHHKGAHGPAHKGRHGQAWAHKVPVHICPCVRAHACSCVLLCALVCASLPLGACLGVRACPCGAFAASAWRWSCVCCTGRTVDQSRPLCTGRGTTGPHGESVRPRMATLTGLSASVRMAHDRLPLIPTPYTLHSKP